MRCTFGSDSWSPSDWQFVKRRDAAGQCAWIQRKDCIENDGDHTCMLHRDLCKGDVTVSATMAFADRMAPSILMVSKTSAGADGVRFIDEHVEITVWDQGVNIWRHHTVNGESRWEKAAFWTFSLAKDCRHTIDVARNGKALTITIADHVFGYVEDSLPEEYHVGIAAGEGVNRFYDFGVVRGLGGQSL